MVKYRVPEQFRRGFVVLSGLSTDQVQTFCKAVDGASDSFTADSVANAIRDTIQIPHEDVRSLVYTIFSLIGFIEEGNISVEELVTDMADSYEDIDSGFTGELKESFKRNLTYTINNTLRVKLILKARRLTSDYDRVFSESKVLSDVRFVLNDNLEDATQSAIIVHQLKIEYSQNGDLKHAFYAMDVNDLRKMKISIDRALEKDTKIRAKHYFDDLTFLELSN